jgi:hypothetical protein
VEIVISPAEVRDLLTQVGRLVQHIDAQLDKIKSDDQASIRVIYLMGNRIELSTDDSTNSL